MDFREISYVVAIAKYQNLSKAAEGLYISQPTLSKFLHNLEKTMGQPLFRKLGNRYVLTYAGERYVEAGTKILSVKKDLDEEMSDILKRHEGILKVAFPTVRGTYIIPDTLPAFRLAYPNVKVKLQESHSTKLDAMLLSGETDLAFYNLSAVNPLIEYVPITKEEIVLVLAKGHPLGKTAVKGPNDRYPRIDLRLLENETLIMQTPQQRSRQIVDEVFEQMGLHFSKRLVMSNIQASVMLASEGYGAALVCETHLKHMKFEKPIECFSFGEKGKTESLFVAAYRKGSYLPQYAKYYIGLIKRIM
jgi:DNA-binding transcriptional LysR family regulator